MQHAELYNAEYYQGHADRGYAESYGLIAEWLHAWCAPGTVIDIGCGGGFLISAFADLDVIATGFDASPDAGAYAGRAMVGRYDLRTLLAMQAGRMFSADLVCSIEVIEHVPAPLSLPMLKMMRAMAPRVCLTAASDGGPEIGHVNVRSRGQWIALAEQAGLDYLPDETDRFCRAMRRTGRRILRLRANNAMIFARGGD